MIHYIERLKMMWKPLASLKRRMMKRVECNVKLTQTWNQHAVKKENKTLVLETIKNTNPISRAQIANVTGLNKGTVSSLVSELIGESLIYESGPGESSGGRRPVMLLFNQTAGYAIGIDIGRSEERRVGKECQSRRRTYHGT